MENRRIKIVSDVSIMPKESVTIHINYTEALTLKELSEILDLINKAINDVNRKNGVGNVKLAREYAPEVEGVESGSIVVHILASFVAPVAMSMLANYLYDRLKNIGAKKVKQQIQADTAYPISISINGNDNLIELNVQKPSNYQID